MLSAKEKQELAQLRPYIKHNLAAFRDFNAALNIFIDKHRGPLNTLATPHLNTDSLTDVSLALESQYLRLSRATTLLKDPETTQTDSDEDYARTLGIAKYMLSLSTLMKIILNQLELLALANQTLTGPTKNKIRDDNLELDSHLNMDAAPEGQLIYSIMTSKRTLKNITTGLGELQHFASAQSLQRTSGAKDIQTALINTTQTLMNALKHALHLQNGHIKTNQATQAYRFIEQAITLLGKVTYRKLFARRQTPEAQSLQNRARQLLQQTDFKAVFTGPFNQAALLLEKATLELAQVRQRHERIATTVQEPRDALQPVLKHYRNEFDNLSTLLRRLEIGTANLPYAEGDDETSTADKVRMLEKAIASMKESIKQWRKPQNTAAVTEVREQIKPEEKKLKRATLTPRKPGRTYSNHKGAGPVHRKKAKAKFGPVSLFTAAQEADAKRKDPERDAAIKAMFSDEAHTTNSLS